jgi:hypothetical protein
MSLLAATGVARLARFQADGLASFDATPNGLLNALAPWLGFALVGFVLVLVSGSPLQALGDLLATVVALLTPAVLSQALARLWGREAGWLRYAVAFTWCQWVMPAALLASLLGSLALVAIGLPEDIAEFAGAIALLGYSLALHGFLVRRTLNLRRWRLAAMVAAVNLGTVALVMLPVAAQVLLHLAVEGTA